MSKKTEDKQVKHHRSGWLTFLLVIIVLQGLIATYFFHTWRIEGASISRPWLLALMSLHSFANVIAALGIWKWKMWGWQVYVASSFLAMVVGLVSLGLMSIFYEIIPVMILGTVLRTQWKKFS